MGQIGRTAALAIVLLATESAIIAGNPAPSEARVSAIAHVNARIIATNIPGASAIAQIGEFLRGGTLVPGGCTNPSPIPIKFSAYTETGAVLDPTRLLVGSQSNFGAPLALGIRQEGSFLSIDPTGSSILNIPRNGVPLWTETACRFPPKPPAGLNRNRLSETPKFGRPELPIGQFAIQSGPMMAAFDIFEITIKGRGGHAAMPHLVVDPVVAAAQVVNGLQTIASRNTHPLESAVVSVTQIHGGDTWNVIPETVVLRGTTP